MRVFHQHGTKERLFEMVRKVGGAKLNEAILPKEKKIEVINDFVKFVNKKLKFGKQLPDVILSDDEKEAETMHSFGKFTPEIKEIRVVIANRNLADILRTLAHELVHYKQHLDGVLTPKSNDTGSEHENEANALAGALMREFGKLNSIIFE
jgi:Zn-dependent peptidase ImmA (M78 family)